MNEPASRGFRVADIAAQAGLSRATVDRVLHRRSGVRPETIAQVERAIEELARQQDQVLLSTQTVILDVVMQAPSRFTDACRSALEAELPRLRPAAVRARFQLSETSDPAGAVRVLDQIAARGSGGVLLKAPAAPDVRAAIDRLHGAGIPTVTVVTDVGDSRRFGYVGLDNAAAGATAAYLLSLSRAASQGVLVTLSNSSFQGEEERADGFKEAWASLAPGRPLIRVTDTDGLDETLAHSVGAVLDERPDLDAVYSVGGGNRAVLEAFAQRGRARPAFIAHDLDADNRALLRTRQVDVVLHHDLYDDMRRAAVMILQARKLLPGHPAEAPTQVQVITPFNEPRAPLRR